MKRLFKNTKEFLKLVKKRVKPSHLLLLALTFVFGSYSWFIYSTKVTGNLSAQVRSWNIRFEAGEQDVNQFINFKIDDMYPGMNSFTDSIKAYNKGDTLAKLSYEIISARVFNDDYIVGDNNLTSEMLLKKLEQDFPFSLKLSVSNSEITSATGEEEFRLDLTWPFDTGRDALDTKWGEEAYDFNILRPDDTMIEVIIKITAVQK